MELQGFLVSIHTPHERCLKVEVDVSHLDDYSELVEALKNRLYEIDRKYSARIRLMRRRSLKTRYRRVAVDDRQHRLRFSPLPSKYSNIISNLRARVYKVLIPSTCFCLEGVASRKLYFLPKGMVSRLLEAVEKINNETIAKANKEIEKFTRGKEYIELIQLLHGHGLDASVLSQTSFAIKDLAIDILPVDFSYSKQKYEEYISAIIRDIMSRLAPIIAAKSYRGLRIRQKLGGLIDICDGAGLESVSERVLRPLLEICGARTYSRRELIERHFGTENLKGGVEKAMRELMTPFGGLTGE